MSPATINFDIAGVTIGNLSVPANRTLILTGNEIHLTQGATFSASSSAVFRLDMSVEPGVVFSLAGINRTTGGLIVNTSGAGGYNTGLGSGPVTIGATGSLSLDTDLQPSSIVSNPIDLAGTLALGGGILNSPIHSNGGRIKASQYDATISGPFKK